MIILNTGESTTSHAFIYEYVMDSGWSCSCVCVQTCSCACTVHVCIFNRQKKKGVKHLPTLNGVICADLFSLTISLSVFL